MASYGHLCDVDDEIVEKLLTMASNWTLFNSRGNNSRFIDIITMDYLIYSLPEKYNILSNIYTLMLNKISSNGEKIIPMQMLLCYYPDGSYSTGMHKHNCRSITVSIGFERLFQINSEQIILKNGDFVVLYKQRHGVPKSSSFTGPRISLNLFYCHIDDQNVNITG